MKVALVHDYLNQYGGAERVLEVFCDLFYEAPIYTLLYDEKLTGGAFKDRKIKTSFLQKIPGAVKNHKWILPFMPLAIEQFDFSKFDIVISISASYAKGIIVGPKTKHINYCLTPLRYGWDDSQKYLSEANVPIVKIIAPLLLNYLRIWDLQAGKRPDEMVAISDFVAQRINKYYHRQVEIIYPPVDVSKYYTSEDVGPYYLMVGRLVPYKKFDLAIRAFNVLNLPLKIVGTGPELNNLKKIAGSNIEFIGQIDDEKLASLLSKCKALIFPQEEDFGMVPLEAMASGRPVIAFRSGGAMETVSENVSGLFFKNQTVESLIDAVGRFKSMEVNPHQIRESILKFDIKRFKIQISNLINKNESRS